MSSHLKAELAATCSTLGRFHKGEYLIEPECIESVKDLIRYLKRDSETHDIRRYLGESKVLQNDLIHIVKSCPEENTDLFDVTLRLLINLTTPTMLFYGEEIPTEKITRNIYLSLVSYSQDYKMAFCDVEFWNKICGKLTNLFETDWAERSADDGIQIERILMLLRNVLQVPADEESEKRPDNDVSVHDKVLWALRQSQILELLLFISSNENEAQYFLNLLEIFSLILREQNPKLLARCDIERSAAEKSKDTEDLVRVRESEKKNRNKYLNMRNFNATFIMKGVKSLSNKDVVCHKSLEKVNNWDLNESNKKQVKTRRNRIPVESERVERRSSFSVRLFLKEFSLEFLNCSFGNLMAVVKNKLDSGKSLANDQTYYFWALKFFLDFACSVDADVEIIKGFLASESFHFVQTSMENAFEHLMAEKKKTVDWVKRIHLILKAYHSLLEALLWMDCSKNPLTRSISREIKSQIFYVVEYREMTLHLLLRYDPTKFSISYLRDLIETTHLFVKLLEEYSKQTRLVVQKVERKKSSKKKRKKVEEITETREEKWEKIKDDVYDILCSESTFPEIPPFDAALDIPVDDQKGRAMKKIQGFLFEANIRDAIGFLRSARQVWPENDHFGSEGMSVEDETMALQEICLADLGEVEGDTEKQVPEGGEEEEESEDDEDEDRVQIVEQDFDIMDYKKRLVNKKVVEGCGILLNNYKKNSDHTNHCVVKLLHRIGWECCMPAMLFQASLFWTLLKVMRENNKSYGEIQTFGVNLLRKFRKLADKNPVVFLELLFWKEHGVALEIQHGYQPYESKPKKGKSKVREDGAPKKRGRKKKNLEPSEFGEDGNEAGEGNKKGGKKRTGKQRRKKREEEFVELSQSSSHLEENEEKENDTPNKGGNEVSRILFENSESDDDETGANSREKVKNKVRAFESSDEEGENTQEVEEILTDRSRLRRTSSDSREDQEKGDVEAERGKGNNESPTDRSRVRRIFSDSSEDENEKENVEAERGKESDKTPADRPRLRRTFSESSEDENEKENVEAERGKESDKTPADRPRLRRTFSESSEDGEAEREKENEETRTNRSRLRQTLSDSDDERNFKENVEPESGKSSQLKEGGDESQDGSGDYPKGSAEDSVHGKDSDESNSQKSNASSKKRKAGSSSEDSDIESAKTKSKKVRYIGSDSDVEEFESGQEKPEGKKKKKRRKRLAVIDSDSDVGDSWLDEK